MISEGYGVTLQWPVLRYFFGNCTGTAEKSDKKPKDSQSLYWKLKLGPNRYQIFVQITVVILCYSYCGYSYIHYINQQMHSTWHDILFMLCLDKIRLGWYNSWQMSVYILWINVNSCELSHSFNILISNILNLCLSTLYVLEF